MFCDRFGAALALIMILFTILQKTDGWVPGSARNPETYILRDQVLIEKDFKPFCFSAVLGTVR